MANGVFKPKYCAGKDNFERINYLYQLSNLAFKTSECPNTASSLYSNLALNIAKKSVQRVEPTIKRTLCRKCRTLVIAGISCKVRIKKKEIIWTCNTCKQRKIFKSTRNYQLWIDNTESIVERLQY